jgi:NAD(P)-dependent dehydrogenase (short-subunit alcohol dehydrogenase family)
MTATALYPSLSGKRAVVTGGGSGIGAGVVEALARQGSKVVFLDVDEAASSALVQRLRAEGRQTHFVRCDLTDLNALQAAFAAIGAVDVLVNNAANDDRHRVEQITPASWDSGMAVNLRHLLFCTQAVVPGMRARGAGSVINFGSVSWHLALPELVLYETAKAGIEGMTRALARDLGPDGIRVNCVVPGAVRTPRQSALWTSGDEEARILEQQCLKTRIDPEHVAALVLFLAADDSCMCTAHSYCVDAGWR